MKEGGKVRREKGRKGKHCLNSCNQFPNTVLEYKLSKSEEFLQSSFAKHNNSDQIVSIFDLFDTLILSQKLDICTFIFPEAGRAM